MQLHGFCIPDYPVDGIASARSLPKPKPVNGPRNPLQDACIRIGTGGIAEMPHDFGGADNRPQVFQKECRGNKMGQRGGVHRLRR